LITIKEIFSLLIEYVPKAKALGLVDKCKEVGMSQIPYVNGVDSNLPHSIDNGFHFECKLDGTSKSKFVILESKSLIMQAGIEIAYEKPLPLFKIANNYNENYNLIKRLSDEFYGLSQLNRLEITGDRAVEFFCNGLPQLNRVKTAGEPVIECIGEAGIVGVSALECINYGNASSVFYLTKGNISGHDFIIFKAGSREFW